MNICLVPGGPKDTNVRCTAYRILYIVPTKALINDLEKRLIGPLEKLHLNLGIRHGDRDDLHKAKTPNILITTPESLDVMLFRKEQALNTIKAVLLMKYICLVHRARWGKNR